MEIGGCLPYCNIKPFNVGKWYAIDPRNKNEKVSDNYITQQGYSQLIPQADCSFDFIFSCNAFQHIHNFQMALDEMYRVLKPKGVLYSNFGPIWSAPDGSHIENVVYNEKIYNFWEEHIIPDWYHLIYNCSELYGILLTKLEEGLAKTLAEYVYMSSWLNRMTYFDFENAIKTSNFSKILFFNGTKEFGYDQKSIDYVNNLAFRENDWRKDKKDLMKYYEIRDLKICLVK